MKAATSESFGYNEDQIVSSDVIGMRYGSLYTKILRMRRMNNHIEVLIQIWYIFSSSKKMHITHFLLSVCNNFLLILFSTNPMTSYKYKM